MVGDQKSIHEAIAGLIKELELTLRDAEKFDKGNSSAGTRVRKRAQDAIKHLKDIRKTVSDLKDSRKTQSEEES